MLHISNNKRGDIMDYETHVKLMNDIENTRVVYYNGYCIEYRNLEELSEKLTALKLKPSSGMIKKSYNL